MTEEGPTNARVPVAEADLDDLTKATTYAALIADAKAVRGARRPRAEAFQGGLALVALVAAWLSRHSATELGSRVRDVSEKMFSFAGAVLGILLAAFAILAIIAPTDAALFLSRRRPAVHGRPAQRFSELKRIALLFVLSFHPFLLFTVWYGALTFVGFYGGPATWIATCLDSVQPGVAKFLAAAVFGATAWWFGRFCTTLTAVVVNIYMAFMLLARANAELNADVIEEQSTDSASSSVPGVPTTRVADEGAAARGETAQAGDDAEPEVARQPLPPIRH